MQRLILRFACSVLACEVLAAQPAETAGPIPGTLFNVGQPLRVDPQCTVEKAFALELPCSSEEPCQTYLELHDAVSAGNRIFLTGNLHTGRSTIESMLLTSEDSGKSWTEAHSRIPSAVLEKAQFLDFETGWIAGQIATTLPRDPFLLVTNDGGKSWSRRPLFGETRVSSIEKFWFESRTHGSLLLDRMQSGETGLRHELYETQTGGNSWSLRQVDRKPIPVKAMPVPMSDLRLRIDAGTRTNRLERKQGERWTVLASFFVSAGECAPKTPPEALLEPAPSEPAAENPSEPPAGAQNQPKTQPRKIPSLQRERR